MRGYYTIFVLTVFVYQLSIQITSQNKTQKWSWPFELANEFEQLPFLRNHTRKNVSNAQTNWNIFSVSPSRTQKPSNWIKMKDIKAVSFSYDHYTTGQNHYKQLNCLSGDLCELGPQEVECSHVGFHDSEFSYHCKARMASNIQFDRLNITCERHFQEHEKVENLMVLKGSCYLNYTIKQVDYVILYWKEAIGFLCFVIALALIIFAFHNCRKTDERGKRVFLTPSYFTRPASIFH